MRMTSIIYGMPQAALATAGADRVVALPNIADAIVDLLRIARRGSGEPDMERAS